MKTKSVPFAEASKIVAAGSHEYTSHVHSDYCYGPAANGGYAASLLWKAVATHFNTTLAKYQQPDTISFHTEFLLPVMLGDVTICIEDARLGKASSTVHVTMTQQGKQRMGAYFTNINRSIFRGISNTMGLSMGTMNPRIPPINHSAVLVHKDPIWTSFQVPYKDPSMNKCLSNMIFVMQKEPCPDRSITQMWLGLSDPEAVWTDDMLPIGCDMFVPSLENFYPDSDRSIQSFARQSLEWAEKGVTAQHRETEWKLPRWYTTVNMTVEVKRALPKEGVRWLFTKMKVNEVVDGRLDVQGWVWDERGRFLALAQYQWFVVESERAVVSKAKKERTNKM